MREEVRCACADVLFIGRQEVVQTWFLGTKMGIDSAFNDGDDLADDSEGDELGRLGDAISECCPKHGVVRVAEVGENGGQVEGVHSAVTVVAEKGSCVSEGLDEALVSHPTIGGLNV